MIATHLSQPASDARWIQGLKRREPWAWDRLRDEALDPVFGYLALRCRRREEAEDLTAEVFAAAVASIHQFRGDSRLTTWLIGIARRKQIDAERRRRRHPEVLATDLSIREDEMGPAGYPREWVILYETAPEPPDALFQRRAVAQDVRRLVLELPEAQREAIWLRCVDQLPIAEVAVLLQRSEDAVKALLRRARSAVLEGLRAEDAAPVQISSAAAGLKVEG